MVAKVINSGISIFCASKVLANSKNNFDEISLKDFPREKIIRDIALGIILGSAKIFINITFLSLFPTPILVFKNLILLHKIACVSCIIFLGIDPLLEEKMFRDFLLTKQLEENSVGMAILKNALLFGGFHCFLGGNSLTSGMTNFLYSSIGGLFYAGIAVFSKSYLPSTIAHSISNISQCFLRCKF